jgi:hypothetical protein
VWRAHHLALAGERLRLLQLCLHALELALEVLELRLCCLQLLGDLILCSLQHSAHMQSCIAMYASLNLIVSTSMTK